MNTQVVHEVFIQTQEGKMTFPEGVRRLQEAGVESYLVDLAAARKTCYLADGTSHTEAFFLRLDPIADEFSPTALVAALRAAQVDTMRYPEFLKCATAAGVIGYWAFLTGKRVVYLGRKGEIHVEEFPRAKP